MAQQVTRGRIYTGFVNMMSDPTQNEMPWATLVMAAMMINGGSMSVSEIDRAVSFENVTNYNSIYGAVRSLERLELVEKKEDKSYKTTVRGRATYRKVLDAYLQEQQRPARWR